jgi:CHAT domain-containing protein
MWPRAVEPQLSRPTEWRPCARLPRNGRAVGAVQCGDAAPLAKPGSECDRQAGTRDEALELLTAHPACTDTAIAALEQFHDLADLPAAYYLRAQREDRPADLLLALDASLALPPSTAHLPPALFNRALIDEALGLTDDAIAAWDEFLLRTKGTSPWASEARARRNELHDRSVHDAATKWRQTLPSLTAALLDHKEKAVEELISPFPATSLTYLENELIPHWAASRNAEELAQLRVLATAWSRRNHDPYADDVVASIESVDPKGIAALQEARRLATEFKNGEATAAYRKAAPLLGNHPLQLVARLEGLVRSSVGPEMTAPAIPQLEPIEQEARRLHYEHLVAQTIANRGYFYFNLSRAVESSSKYAAALGLYERLGDSEDAAKPRVRLLGEINELGQTDRAFREAVLAMRDISFYLSTSDQHVLLGETADAAAGLGHPKVAIRYLAAAERDLRSALIQDPTHVARLRTNLAVLLRHRAKVAIRLGDSVAATADLNESERLAGKNNDPDIVRELRIGAAEVEGQKALLAHQLARAVDAFTTALEGTTKDERRTFRTSLYAQRADAYRLLGNPKASEDDLRRALRELAGEESLILSNRTTGENEEVWSPYFSRFAGTYRLLIQQLAESGREREAFAYAERARAYEPLDLILRQELVPESLRRLARKSSKLDVGSIEARLPAGTFLVEYCVLDNRTLAWVVGHGGTRMLVLPATAKDAQRWTTALQEAVRKRAEKAVNDALVPPYEPLVAQPLAAIRALNGGRAPERVVFVPDRQLQGIPFAALRNPDTKQYLIETLPVEMAGSALLYAVSLDRDRIVAAEGGRSVLLIGNPHFDRTLPAAQGLPPLLGAEDEVVQLQELYHSDARARVGDDATVPEFLALARDAAIVHVAAHTIIDAQAPSRSVLLLAPSKHHSGALEAQELLTRLKLDRTHLVLLASCRSAEGAPVGPEGVAPLVRPLIAAGVPAVIGSLWDVEDATAASLLVSFHRHYRQGSDAALALRQAQLSMLRNDNPGLRSVLAWAPFQVIGHASSPFAATRHN